MLLAAQQGEVVGVTMICLVMAALVGIPISVAIVKNRRYAQTTRYARMWGWVPGNPEIGRVHSFENVPSSPYGTAGPRVVHEETTGFGKRAWIVAGDPPTPRKEEVGTPATVAVAPAATPPLESGAHIVDTAVREESVTSPSVYAVPDVPEVRVLGPVEVLGWVKEPDRRIIPELACFRALHCDRSVPGEEIRAALWPGDLETTGASMKSLSIPPLPGHLN